MAISAEEGALKLYELLYGERDRRRTEEAAATVARVPTKDQGTAPARRSCHKKKVMKCRECGRRRPNAGRGLCCRCYYRVRKEEAGSKEQGANGC
jgi:hypothetical protein